MDKEKQDIEREFENIIKLEETCIGGEKTVPIKSESDYLVSSSSGSKCQQCKKLAKIALKEKRRADGLQAGSEEVEIKVMKLEADIQNITNERDNLLRERNELVTENKNLNEDIKRISRSLQFTTEKLNHSRSEFSQLSQQVSILKYELSQGKQTDSDIEILEDLPVNNKKTPKYQDARERKVTPQKTSRLQCPVCLKIFMRPCGLGSHRRTHKQ